MRRRLLVAFVLAHALGCRSAAVPVPTTAPTSPAPATTSSAAGTDPSRDPLSVRWVRDAAEYRAIVVQTYRVATKHVEDAARTRQAGSWAVVLDADETVISNLVYQIERSRQGLSFSADSWYAWVRRQEATPLPGARAFLARVRELGGRIAIVTNRRTSECNDTIAVFRKHELTYDAMLCRPDEGPSDKNIRFEAVGRGEAIPGGGTLEIVAFVGDNILDFPGLSQQAVLADDAALDAFGTRYFALPNPMYGSWER